MPHPFSRQRLARGCTAGLLKGIITSVEDRFPTALESDSSGWSLRQD